MLFPRIRIESVDFPWSLGLQTEGFSPRIPGAVWRYSCGTQRISTCPRGTHSALACTAALLSRRAPEGGSVRSTAEPHGQISPHGRCRSSGRAVIRSVGQLPITDQRPPKEQHRRALASDHEPVSIRKGAVSDARALQKSCQQRGIPSTPPVNFRAGEGHLSNSAVCASRRTGSHSPSAKRPGKPHPLPPSS